MIRNRTRAMAATAIAAGVLVVAGCGGSTPTSSTSTNTTPATTAPADAVTFSDPAGDFTIGVSPTWKARTSTSSKLWFLSSQQRDFNDYVNVLVEKVPRGVDLAQYITVSKQNAPKYLKNVEWKSEDTVTLTSGKPATRLRYSGTARGVTAEFLQLITLVEGKRAVVVTLTGTADRIEADIVDAEPYMRTVDPLG